MVHLNGNEINPLAQITGAPDIVLGQTHTECGDFNVKVAEGRLKIVLTGEDSCKLEIEARPAVRMQSKIETDFTEFNQTEGLNELVLFLSQKYKVDPSQIVVNSYYQGSVVVDYYIVSKNSDASTLTQQSDVNKIINTAQDQNNHGNMDYKFKNGTTAAVKTSIDGTIFVDHHGNPINTDSDKERILIFAGIGAASIVGVLVCLKCFSIRKHTPATEEQAKPDLDLRNFRTQSIELQENSGKAFRKKSSDYNFEGASPAKKKSGDNLEKPEEEKSKSPKKVIKRGSV